ncbi:hypothetical protein FIBSPDRAFT_962756 [Athelia psychrophila]|uniref:Retrotransposon gag domain-containing protein n=1 Tax=Athelia psychrophila TaxID=1759441 RepID=A0A165ZS12_9AGAM|nr:hypothetical protein FIBSPDRAFT_962756 [Fibularhizoctonia sp. CBS 109695]
MSQSTYDFPLFHGDYDETTETDLKADTPIQWLGKLERCFTSGTSDKDKIYAFRVNLERGSTASDWWKGIADTEKDTWDKVVDLFEAQWPPTKLVATGTTAKKALLLNLRLEESKLGEMEGTGRSENYSHIKWADKVHKLWKGLNDPSGHLLDQIRPNMPKALLDVISLSTADKNSGEKFFEAVRAVDVERMMQKFSESKAMRELEERVNALSIPSQYANHSPAPTAQHYQQTYYSPSYTPPHHRAQPTPGPQTPVPQPTAGLNHYAARQTPAHLPITPAAPHQGYLPTPANSALNNPFSDQTTPRPNNFSRQLAQTQASPLAGRGTDSNDIARRIAIESIPYQDTPEGVAAYTRAYTEWEARWGADNLCTFITDRLPLSPGTSPLGSKECYTCGIASTPPHLGFDCLALDHKKIPVREKQWRTYINKALWNAGQRSTPGRRSYQASPIIAQIAVTDDGYAYDPNIYPADSLQFEDDPSSGNGQESHY